MDNNIADTRARLERDARNRVTPLTMFASVEDVRAILDDHERLLRLLSSCRPMVVEYKRSYDSVLYMETMAECEEIIEAIDAYRAVQS